MAGPGRLRRWVVRPVFWAIATLAVAFAALLLFLETPLARERARDLLRARIADTLGREIEIATVDFSLLPLSLEVRGVVIGGESPQAPPFATLRRARVEAELEGFGRSEIVLRSVEIEGLDLALEFRGGGEDNIPRPRGTGKGGESRLRVDGVRIDDSVVRIAEQTLPLELEARAVMARLVGAGGRDVQGDVVAQEVDLALPRAESLRLAVAAKFRLRGDRLEIQEARVTAPDLVARAHGAIAFAPATVDLAVSVETSGQLADRLGYLSGEIAGPVRVDGRVEWSKEAWGFRGAVDSPGLDLFGFRLDAIQGSVAVEKRALRVDLARGRFEGGEAHGAFEVDLEPGRYPARLEVGVAGADLGRALDRFGLPGERLAGEVSGTFRYDLELKKDGHGVGVGDFEVLPTAGDAPGRFPATGSVRVQLEDRRLELPSIELATPGVRAVASGTYDLAAKRGAFDFEADAEDLGELVELADLGAPEDLWRPSEGTGIVSGRVSLGASGVVADLQIAGAAVVAPGLRASRLSGTVVAGERAIEALDLDLELGNAHLTLSGTVPFAGDGLDLLLRAERWPLDQAAPWLPFELPVAGPVSGTLRLTGGLEQLSGDLEIAVAPATVAGIELERLEGSVRFDPDRVEVTRGVAAAPAGRVEASGSLAIAGGTLDFGVAAPVIDLDADPFVDALEGRIGGRLSARGRLQGTLEDPRLEIEVEGDALVVAGEALAPEAPLRLSARLAEGHVAIEGSIGDLVRVTGGGPFAAAGDGRLELDVATERLGRWATLAAGAPVEGIGGEARGTLVVETSAGAAPAIELRLAEVELVIGERRFRALEPVRVAWSGGDLEIGSLYLGDAAGADELFVTGRVLLAAEPRLDLRVQASMAAEALGAVLGGYELGGQIDLLAVVSGPPSRPTINGQASLSEGRFLPEVVPHSFDRIQALALFYPNAIVLDRLDASFAGGSVTAAGRIELPSAGEPSYRFELAADHLTMRYPAGWLLRGDVDLSLASTPEGRQLRGEARLDRAFYLQDVALSPAQLIQRLLTKGRIEEGATDDLLATTSLGIVVKAPHALRVRNNLASLRGGGELTLRGSLARPVVFGEIAMDEGSKVNYGGNEYELARARVFFANPTRIEPVLDVVARTKIEPYLVDVLLDGPISNLSTTFTSNPPLPDLDVLGLIATGTPLGTDSLTGVGPTGAGAEATGTGSQAAETLLYGQAASLLSSRVNRLFGLDTLRIDPLTVGDSVSTARVTVGKRVSKQLFVTYSYDPSTTAQQILQVEWRLTDKITLVLTQNGNESYAVDARWESRF